MTKRFLIALEITIILTVLVLSPQLKLPWMLIDDGENLRMGQEIDNHFKDNDYSWILSYEKVNGRFRPAYWLWHYTNFKIFGFDAYSHHLGHLLLYVFISILIFLIAKAISKSNLAGFLSVLFFLFFYPAAENYYRLGTAEPPLLFLYLLLAFLLTRIYLIKFSSKISKTSSFDICLLFIVLGFTYFMKETAVVLIVAYIPLFIAGFIDRRIEDKKSWFKFSIFFIFINVFFFLLTVFLKNIYGISGGYAEAYKPTILDTFNRFFSYLKMVAQEYRWVLIIPAFTFSFSLLKTFNKAKGSILIFLKSLPSAIIWELVFLSWFLIFLAVQSPWLYVMGRYLPPVIVWISIVLGIEYAKILVSEGKFFWKIFPERLSFELPVLKILSVFFILWLVLSHGKKIAVMYRGALVGEYDTTQVVKFLAKETPLNGFVYVNFSEGIMEYLYELPLHFKFFYERSDIKTDYLYLDKQNNFKKGDFIITFKEQVQRYPVDEIKRALHNTEEVNMGIYGPNWRILKFDDDEFYNDH